MSLNPTDVRALIAVTRTATPVPFECGGATWPIYPHSTGAMNALFRRFPASANALLGMVFAVDAKDREAEEKAAASAQADLTKTMLAEGGAFCGAYLNLRLGGSADAATEEELLQMPDEVLLPLWARTMEGCPRDLEGFLYAMAVGAGIPVPPLAALELPTVPAESEPLSTSSSS